jgi:hypothetical protein
VNLKNQYRNQSPWMAMDFLGLDDFWWSMHGFWVGLPARDICTNNIGSEG